MGPHDGPWAERPQNKPERKQAVSQMESGPWALAECNVPFYLFYLEFLEALCRSGNSRGIFYIVIPHQSQAQV